MTFLFSSGNIFPMKDFTLFHERVHTFTFPFSIPSLITNPSIYCFNKMHKNKNNKEMLSD